MNTEEPQEGLQSDPQSETLAQLKSYQSGEPLPVGAQQEPEPAPEPEPEPPEGGAAEPVPTQDDEPIAASAGIVVDGKEFASEKEAYQYAQTKLQAVETEKLILQARQEGMEAALLNQPQSGQAPVEAPAEPIDDSDEYYADPTAYLRKKEAALAAKIKADIESQIANQRQDEQLWGEFFEANPDLSGFKEHCQQALTANLDTIRILAAKDKKKAMDFLATKARQPFQDYVERQKPRTTLPNHGGGPSSGANPGVTQSKTVPKDDDALDFTSQLRNMRNN